MARGKSPLRFFFLDCNFVMKNSIFWPHYPGFGPQNRLIGPKNWIFGAQKKNVIHHNFFIVLHFHQKIQFLAILEFFSCFGAQSNICCCCCCSYLIQFVILTFNFVQLKFNFVGLYAFIEMWWIEFVMSKFSFKFNFSDKSNLWCQDSVFNSLNWFFG